MRQFALGCLGYDPERFGRMIVGDFFDAMQGHNERELERLKTLAEIVRTSTTIMVNIQLKKEDKVSPQELWPLPWDEKKDERLSPQDYKRMKDASLKWMTDKFFN